VSHLAPQGDSAPAGAAPAGPFLPTRFRPPVRIFSGGGGSSPFGAALGMSARGGTARDAGACGRSRLDERLFRAASHQSKLPRKRLLRRTTSFRKVSRGWEHNARRRMDDFRTHPGLSKSCRFSTSREDRTDQEGTSLPHSGKCSPGNRSRSCAVRALSFRQIANRLGLGVGIVARTLQECQNGVADFRSVAPDLLLIEPGRPCCAPNSSAKWKQYSRRFRGDLIPALER